MTATDPGSGDELPLVVVLCTGNAARSVMAGAMLTGAQVRLVTAGTHVVEGQPMSRRTRAALDAVGIRLDALNGHRSRQLTAEDVDGAALVLAMAGDHVRYIRRVLPQAAAKTATIKGLCRDLAASPEPLADRIRALDLANTEPEEWEDVSDPAGGEDDDYVTCAKELLELCTELTPRLR